MIVRAGIQRMDIYNQALLFLFNLHTLPENNFTYFILFYSFAPLPPLYFFRFSLKTINFFRKKVPMNWINELNALKRGIRKTQIEPINRKKIAKELIANGVAWILSIVITLFLKQFFAVKNIRNLWGLGAKDKVLVSQTTFDILGWIAAFILGMFVFTLVEKIMENYLEERNKSQ